MQYRHDVVLVLTAGVKLPATCRDEFIELRVRTGK